MTRDEIIDALTEISNMCHSEGDSSPLSDAIIAYIKEIELINKAYSDAIDRLQRELTKIKNEP